METVLNEDILREVLTDVTSHEALTPKVLHDIFISLITFQSGLANQCSRSYEAFTPKIETAIKEAMGRAFKKLLKQQYSTWPTDKLELHSIMLSWSLYGFPIFLPVVRWGDSKVVGELPGEIVG